MQMLKMMNGAEQSTDVNRLLIGTKCRSALEIDLS